MENQGNIASEVEAGIPSVVQQQESSYSPNNNGNFSANNGNSASRTDDNNNNSGGANARDDCSDLTDNNNDNEEQAPKSFPQKLLDVLKDERHSDIISWLPHGNGFLIHKKKTFAAEILPKYFKASKFTSFTRKLNRWGFTRISRGPETGAYYHKLFRRDQQELCLQMTSNSGSKYHQMQAAGIPQHLLPNGTAAFGAMPGMFPYMAAPPMMPPNMTPQQQQAFWQQQMQSMMQMQQMHLMQMQQQQGRMQPQGVGMPDGVGMMPPMMMMPIPPNFGKPFEAGEGAGPKDNNTPIHHDHNNNINNNNGSNDVAPNHVNDGQMMVNGRPGTSNMNSDGIVNNGNTDHSPNKNVHNDIQQPYPSNTNIATNNNDATVAVNTQPNGPMASTADNSQSVTTASTTIVTPQVVLDAMSPFPVVVDPTAGTLSPQQQPEQHANDDNNMPESTYQPMMKQDSPTLLPVPHDHQTAVGENI